MAQLATVQEAAERLAVHPMTVRRLIERGQMPAVRVGRAIRIDVNDIRRYLDANRVEGPA